MTWHPDDNAKRAHLLEVFRRRGHDTFIESGTFVGGTVAFFLPHARRIVSVEIDRALHARAAKAFEHCPNVWIRLGDATNIIPEAVIESRTAPLVWLDGHYSGGITGRGAEDEPALTILRVLRTTPKPGTTIVIDDLRLFGTEPGWPPLTAMVDTVKGFQGPHHCYAACDALVIEI